MQGGCKEEEEHKKKKILEDTIRSKRILKGKERAMLKEEEKLNEDFEVAQRTFRDASGCLQKAIVENDGVEIKVASEMIATSQRKLKRREQNEGRTVKIPNKSRKKEEIYN